MNRGDGNHPVVVRVAELLLDPDKAKIFGQKRDEQVYRLLLQRTLLLPCGGKRFRLRGHLLNIGRVHTWRSEQIAGNGE